MDKKEIYYKYFEEKILPKLYNLEAYRLKKVRKVVLVSFLSFISGIFFAYLFIFIAMKHNITVVLLPVLLFIMYTCFIKSIINLMLKGKEYQNWLVQNIFPYFLEPVANFKFWPKNSNTDTILNSQLFGNFDTQEDATSIFGIYKDNSIIISNTALKIPVNHIVFKGTTIQIELNNSIENHIVLISKNAHKFNKYKQVNPHIEDLNKYLYTFAKNTNNLEIINEDFRKTLKRFGELYTAKELGFSYNNNTILITLKQKRPWRFGFMFNSLLKTKNYDELIERFIVIYDLIDVLKR